MFSLNTSFSHDTLNQILITKTTTLRTIIDEKDRRFKFLFDISNLKIGDPLAIECIDQCKEKTFIFLRLDNFRIKLFSYFRQ